MPVFAICGPSGAGKDTLIAAAALRLPALHVVRRTITRPAEAGGEPFEPATEADFAARAGQGAFALHWQAHGLCYGIPIAALREAEAGQVVVFNASRRMLPQAMAVFPGLTVIEITAPPEVLAQRLAARGREGAEDIARRLARAAPPPEGLPVLRIDNGGALAPAVDALVATLQPMAAR